MPTRRANAVDFWRGIALVTIFINHIPGIWFEAFTHRNFGFSDSAELFVFLAGFSLRLVVGIDRHKETAPQIVLRLGGRAVTLYAAQIMITMLAVAMIAAAALWLDNPLILDWHNAGAVFQNPVPTNVGLVLLTHQLGYFDILPLYVVLLALAPLIAVIDRFAPRLLLPLSGAIYLVALVFQVNAPTWPVAGGWFFNPFAWQFIYVLGFVVARASQRSLQFDWVVRWLRWPAIALLIGTYIAIRTQYVPDPAQVPQPTYLFIIDKTYLTPLRLIHALCLCIACAGLYDRLHTLTPWLTRFGAMLGRNSLHVFCVGSLLSLAGQLVRVAFPLSVMLDAIVLLAGLAVMWATAWLAEGRQRLAG
ncbi:MAG: OpgC family protein [Beijerinckiaceae bacterium]